MRVLMINDHARVTGGADIHCFELDRLLRARGHEVEFLSTKHPDNLMEAGAFVPQIVNRGSRDSLSGGGAARVATAACWNRTAAKATERILADFRPDVVHAHKLYPQLSVAPLVLAARRGIPVVQTAHDYEFISASSVDDGGHRLDRDETRLSYRALNSALFQIKRAVHVPRVTSWIAVSRDLAAAYESEGGIEMTVLPNFVAAVDEEPRPFADRGGALFVGRLAEEKGVDHVIEVARRLPDLQVTIAGLGPLEAMVREATADLPNLSFVGSLTPDGVAEGMRAARVVLMPAAWREPGPLVSLEAMATGTPVAAYRRGGLAEYIGEAGAGRVIPPDPAEMVGAVSDLVSDPRRWQECSDAAIVAARSTHAPDTYIRRLESIYSGAGTSARSAR